MFVGMEILRLGRVGSCRLVLASCDLRMVPMMTQKETIPPAAKQN